MGETSLVNMFGRKKPVEVLCIGSTSIDIFFPTDEGEIIDTPEDITSKQKLAFELGGKILVPELYTEIGGVAANVAIGLARIGIASANLSCVGKDSNGVFCLNTLQKNNVHTKHICILDDAKTDLSAIIVLLSNGERTIIHNRDANKCLVVAGSDLQAPWIFVSALNGEWQKNMTTILEAQKSGLQKKFHIAFNPGQHNIKEDAHLILRVVRETDLLVLNKDEAIELVLQKNEMAKKEELEDELFLVKTLFQTGAKIVALTDGARGAWVFNGNEFWFLPAPKDALVVDSTGAGDAFTSGFFGALLLQKSIDECLRFGMANSQKVLAQYGTTPGLLARQELEAAICHFIPQKVL